MGSEDMDVDKYLLGNKFNDDFCYRSNLIFDEKPRGALLEYFCTGRSVLHVGFADHEPLIAARFAAGSWLHACIIRAAHVCYGIDINPKAVKVARKLGFTNLYSLDIHDQAVAPLLQSLDVDLVVVPDVIEHLADPAKFLRRLVELFPLADFIVSVPNGLSIRNMIHTSKGIERVNTDHRFWFSPYTLQKVMADAGLGVTELHGCMVSAPKSFKGKILRTLIQLRPIGADVLIAHARCHHQ